MTVLSHPGHGTIQHFDWKAEFLCSAVLLVNEYLYINEK